jgi:hypothetical protein
MGGDAQVQVAGLRTPLSAPSEGVPARRFAERSSALGASYWHNVRPVTSGRERRERGQAA